MLNNLMNKVMGSSLTKNYEVDKEPYMHGGLHNLWKVYRAKKKDRNNMDCSLFIFDKKNLDKKKLSQSQRDEVCNILKKDPQNLTKLRHPNLLSLLEQPQEDQKFIVFATEPIEFNLSSLVFDATKKELIPGDLEIKCLCLELLEALNFLHNTAKNMHMGLAPEHIYITKDGKLKLGGLNFAQQFSTAEALTVPLNFDLKINELAIVPNLRFAAPELSDQQLCSLNSDLFSIGSLIYFMMALNKGRDPFLLNQKDITDKSSHQFEVKQLEKKFSQMMSGFESDFEMLIMQLCNVNNPDRRGPLNEIVSKSWFQDPLLKTIKYLETLDSKDHQNKVQFLSGITLILQKFDKKALLKKVIPLLLDQMKVIQLSVNVLPSVIDVMERPNYLTTTEFREYIWPSLQKLCKAKELPAQSLYQILKNTELFMKFVGPSEFQQNFLILINKSLECGVAKLQFLALTKVPMMIKQIDYQVVKTQIVPRILMILEKPSQVQLKQKTLEILNDVVPNIDSQTMKDKILKTFEKVRATETDPQVCMLMLKIYEQMAKVLGVEEIGLKILPGIIPMLISGTFTRLQFTEMMQSVRRLLDQIEKHKEKDLRDMGQDQTQGERLEIEDKGNKLASISNPTNKDVFDFLGSLDPSLSGVKSSVNQNPLGSNSGTPSSNLSSNLMAGFSGLNLGTNTQTSTASQVNGDPFSSIMGTSSTSFQAPTQGSVSSSLGGGWDNDLPILNDSQKQVPSSFGGSISQPKPQESNGWASFGGQSSSSNPIQSSQSSTFSVSGNQGLNLGSNMQQNSQNQLGGFNSLGGNSFSQPKTAFGGASAFGKSDDPFAELIDNSASSTSGFSGPSFGNQRASNTMGFNNNSASGIAGGNMTGPGPMNLNTMSNNQAQNNTFGGFGSSLQQNNNTFGTFGSQQNPLSGLSNQTNTGMSSGVNFNAMGQQNTNPFGGLNFGAGFGQQNSNQGQMNFGGSGLNMGGGLQLGGAQNSSVNSGGFDNDFFSQFTSGTNQNQQRQNASSNNGNINFGF